MSCPAPHLYQVLTMLESMLGLGSPETFWGTHLRGQRLEGWGGQEGSGSGDVPGGPGVKNLLCNAGDAGLIPGWGTKIPRAAGQLTPAHGNS